VVAGDEMNEADFWLPIGVLAEMCRRGHQMARDVMASAVGSGTRWRACLDALEAAGGEALIDSVIPASSIRDLLACVDVAELADAIQDVAAPCKRWSEELPSLRFATTSRARPLREPKPMSGPIRWIAARMHGPADPANLASLGAEELLEQLVMPAGRPMLPKCSQRGVTVKRPVFCGGSRRPETARRGWLLSPSLDGEGARILSPPPRSSFAMKPASTTPSDATIARDGHS
jgi:hypothetical protein